MVKLPSTIIIATGNQKKLIELQEIFDALKLECQSQDIESYCQANQLAFTSPEENGTDFMANALIKAEYSYNLTGQVSLADDSGLCVEALNGVPGIYSARYALGEGDPSVAQDTRNNEKLLRVLGKEKNRAAYFVCSIALVGLGEKPILIESKWHGSIMRKSSGKRGFGYDPLFMPTGLEISSAQLSAQEKAKISHRGQALALLGKALSDWS